MCGRKWGGMVAVGGGRLWRSWWLFGGDTEEFGMGIFVLVLGVLNSKRIMLPYLVVRDTVCNQPVFQSFFGK